jgi:hypothetical protein
MTFASRQHWIEAGGTAENLTVADWQIAHAASLSAHEGLARANAAAGDHAGYEREAARTRTLIEAVSDADDRALVESQLASITAPG